MDDEENPSTGRATHVGEVRIRGRERRGREEALERFGQTPDRFVCVILDLTMPRMDGEETHRRLKEVRGDIPVILSSGYNEQEVVNRFVGQGLAGFIQKPYRAADLMEKLKEVLPLARE